MDQYQHTDNLTIYLTGAASDGAAQGNADLSLGKYRSSSEVVSVAAELVGAIRGVRVDRVSGNVGTGSAVVIAPTANTLAFTAPGGSAGTAVTIADGETKVLADGTDPDKICRVTRTGSDDLSGSMVLDVVDRTNTIFDNVNYAESTAGDIEYRCLAIKNIGETPVADILVWLDAACIAEIAIGKEAPTGSTKTGYFTDKTVAGEGSAPGGVSFFTPTAYDHADVIAIPDLFPGEIHGIWLRRTIAAATSAVLRELIQMHYQATVVDFS